MACSARVVLPPDSGPKISITRPRGNPPTPSAASSDTAPVEITLTGTRTSLFPSRMMEPLPYCFSICEIAFERFVARSSAIAVPRKGFFSCGAATDFFALTHDQDITKELADMHCNLMSQRIAERRTKGKHYFTLHFLVSSYSSRRPAFVCRLPDTRYCIILGSTLIFCQTVSLFRSYIT